MSGFVRVRAVDGPKHEFDAPVGEVEANPDLYHVMDKEVVSVPREPKYFVPKSHDPKPVGDPTKENK